MWEHVLKRRDDACLLRIVDPHELQTRLVDAESRPELGVVMRDDGVAVVFNAHAAVTLALCALRRLHPELPNLMRTCGSLRPARRPLAERLAAAQRAAFRYMNRTSRFEGPWDAQLCILERFTRAAAGDSPSRTLLACPSGSGMTAAGAVFVASLLMCLPAGSVVSACGGGYAIWRTTFWNMVNDMTMRSMNPMAHRIDNGFLFSNGSRLITNGIPEDACIVFSDSIWAKTDAQRRAIASTAATVVCVFPVHTDVHDGIPPPPWRSRYYIQPYDPGAMEQFNRDDVEMLDGSAYPYPDA